MASDKAWYIDGTGVEPRALHTIDGVSNAAYVSMYRVDNGAAPREIHEDKRPLIDGLRRRGSVHGPRNFEWQVAGEANTAVVGAASNERTRDGLLQYLIHLAEGRTQTAALRTLKATRYDAADNAVSRVIYAELREAPSWEWKPTSYDVGFVGRYDNPHLVLALPWRAPFPWWIDETATATSALTLDGTARTTNITNNGSVPCGLKFNIEGTGASLTIVVTNVTGGAPASDVGSGITLNGVTIDATDGHVVDQYVDDPQKFLAYRESDDSSIVDVLSARPRVWLWPGTNTIQYQVTSGSPSGATIQFWHRNWWKTP